MEPVRVALAGLPRMLAEIVQRVLAQAPDFEVVTMSGGFEEMMDSLQVQEPDVLVAGLRRDQAIERYDSVLRRYPSLRILALEGDGRQAVMYELQPHSVPLGDVSPEGLIEAIRSSTRVRNG